MQIRATQTTPNNRQPRRTSSNQCTPTQSKSHRLHAKLITPNQGTPIKQDTNPTANSQRTDNAVIIKSGLLIQTQMMVCIHNVHTLYRHEGYTVPMHVYLHTHGYTCINTALSFSRCVGLYHHYRRLVRSCTQTPT